MKNDITIHGYLGRDPELREYQNSKGEARKLCNFSVGVNRGTDKDTTDWFQCVAFGRRAEVIEKWFTKGSQILVSGRMQCDKYTDKNGVDRMGWKLIVSDFDFCDSSNSARGQNIRATQANDEDLPDSFEVAEEEIPF